MMENLSSMFVAINRGDFSVESRSSKKVGGRKRIVFKDQRPIPPPQPLQGPRYEKSYPIQGYHSTGVEFKPGDHVLPANELGQKKTSKMYNDLGHGDWTFFSTSPGIGNYGRNIYRVRALGEVQRDPTEGSSWMAPKLEVVNKLQFGEASGTSTHDDYDPTQPEPYWTRWEE